MTNKELSDMIYTASVSLASGSLPVAKAAHLASVCDAISADIQAGRDDGDPRSPRRACAECELKQYGYCLACAAFVGFKHTKCPNAPAEEAIYSAEDLAVQREEVAAFNRGDAPMRRGESYFMSRERDE